MARQFLQLLKLARFEKIELLSTMREAAKAHAEQADFRFHVAMSQQHLKNAEDTGIEPRWLRGVFARVRVKLAWRMVRLTSGLPNASLKALYAFCERWLSKGVHARVVRVFSKRVI